jgi:hypothetical protein
MKNSLAARAKTRRRPQEPFDRAARGVCVGDGWELRKNRGLGVFARTTTKDARSAKRRRREGCGREAAIVRWEHRQPNQGAALLVAIRAARSTRQGYDSGRAAGAGPADRLFGPSLRNPSSNESPLTGKATEPTGRQPATASSGEPQAVIRRSWHMRRSPLSETAPQIRSEFVTLHK